MLKILHNELVYAFWASVSFLPKRGGAGRFGSRLTSTSAPPLHQKMDELWMYVRLQFGICYLIFKLHKKHFSLLLSLKLWFIPYSRVLWLSTLNLTKSWCDMFITDLQCCELDLNFNYLQSISFNWECRV